MPRDTTSERWSDEAELRLRILSDQIKRNARVSLEELIARQAGLSEDTLRAIAGVS